MYLSGEGPRQYHEQFVLLMAECALFVIIKRTRTAHILPLIKEDEEILLNFQTTLFKLMNPSMFGRQIRERLLNDGGNLPALSMETRE